MSKHVIFDFESILSNYPEFLTSSQLVSLGIYKSVDSAYQARLNGNSPPFIKFAHKVLYPKKAVIEFMRSHMYKIEKEVKNDK